LRLNLTATDPEAPPQLLTYSFVLPPPEGAVLDPATGVFEWTPTPAQAPSTNLVMVRVADNGTPSLSADRAFIVTVKEALLLANITRLPTGEISFTLAVAPGKTYRVEYKDDLGAPDWTPLGPDEMAVEETLTIIAATDASPQRFFRVVQLD
jgi:hypothetical protein